MSIPYVVRKKADLSSGERKELWYGVPSKMQRRGGVKNKELAVRMAKTTGFHRGQIEGILSELVESIQDLLSSGHSVTIEGLGNLSNGTDESGMCAARTGNAGESCYFTRIFCGKLKIQQGTEEDKVYPHTF